MYQGVNKTVLTSPRNQVGAVPGEVQPTRNNPLPGVGVTAGGMLVRAVVVLCVVRV